jgi:hypothetical protein
MPGGNKASLERDLACQERFESSPEAKLRLSTAPNHGTLEREYGGKSATAELFTERGS